LRVEPEEWRVLTPTNVGVVQGDPQWRWRVETEAPR